MSPARAHEPCLPSAPLFAGWVEGANAHAALAALEIPGRALWPLMDDDGGQDIVDLRNWNSGMHGGSRKVCEGVLP